MDGGVDQRVLPTLLYTTLVRVSHVLLASSILRTSEISNKLLLRIIIPSEGKDYSYIVEVDMEHAARKISPIQYVQTLIFVPC